jgi:molybdopterin-containing oxidoreductase family iron-sulfur binding subunit
VKLEGRTLEVPAWIDPGHAQDAVTISLGYGRSRADASATAWASTPTELRGSGSVWFAGAGGWRRRHLQPVSTQDHWSIEGRNLVLRQTRGARPIRPLLTRWST